MTELSFKPVQLELGIDSETGELVEVSIHECDSVWGCNQCDKDLTDPDEFIDDGGLGEGHYHVNGHPSGCMICDPEEDYCE